MPVSIIHGVNSVISTSGAFHSQLCIPEMISSLLFANIIWYLQNLEGLVYCILTYLMLLVIPCDDQYTLRHSNGVMTTDIIYTFSLE